MELTIKNYFVSLTVDTLGAQMRSLRGADGCEYLWQGDPKYWKDQAPVLFPYIARLTNGLCRVSGKEYPMCSHGFAHNCEFSVAEQSDDTLTLRLCADAQTLTSYPFDFQFDITYRLSGCTVQTVFQVTNRSGQIMPFGIGGHPGFRVPLEDHEAFEDYYLEFSLPCQPARVGFTPSVYVSGHDENYPLEDGLRLPLRHSLFDDDAIILKDMDHQVTLRSRKSRRTLTVTYPMMQYLGIWHMPKTDAPYVCIEPWSSLPSRQDIVEELTCKSDLVRLAPGAVYTNQWDITVTQEEEA